MTEEGVRVEEGILELMQREEYPLVLVIFFGNIDHDCLWNNDIFPGDV
jgi:hypothetical protein